MYVIWRLPWNPAVSADDLDLRRCEYPPCGGLLGAINRIRCHDPWTDPAQMVRTAGHEHTLFPSPDTEREDRSCDYSPSRGGSTEPGALQPRRNRQPRRHKDR